MRFLRIVPLALVAAALSAVPVASADHYCDADGQVIDVGGMFYIVVDEVAGDEYLVSAWVYCESNGEPGLQRGGVTLLGDPDVCQDSPNPDSCFW